MAGAAATNILGCPLLRSSGTPPVCPLPEETICRSIRQTPFWGPVKTCSILFTILSPISYFAITRFGYDKPPRPPLTAKGLLMSGLIGLGAGLMVGLGINLCSRRLQEKYCR